jgi:hypothetical protein
MPRLSRLATLAALLSPLAVATPARAAAPQTEFINESIAAKWKEADIKRPAVRATDLEFLRRVYIDLIGRVATADEVRDFERDPSRDRRAKLIDRLLNATDYSPRPNGEPARTADGKGVVKFDYADEFAGHWANLWTIWLMSRSSEPRYRDDVRKWLKAELAKGTNHKDLVTALLTASGTSDTSPAVTFVALQLGEKNPEDKRAELGTFDAVPITSRVTRLFLGLQTQCTQCHDHPFNAEWVQADFWGVNAFFRQVARDGEPTPKTRAARDMAAPLQKLTLSDAAAMNPAGRVYYERRDGQLRAIKPTFLKDIAQAEKGEKSEKFLPVSVESAGTRREALAAFVVGHDNFAKAYVNRVWGHLFGRGLNKEAAVDDFGSHNVVVHPELLNRLAADFAKYGYDPKQLLSWICNSDAYQLSHVARNEYADAKYNPYFARMSLKAMSPETLYESILTATRADKKPAVDKDGREERDLWLDKLVAQFGDDEGNELVFNGTIVQALLMMNGREINAEIGRKASNAVYDVMKKYAHGGVANPTSVIDELFLMTLNRHPTGAEMSRIKSLQQNGALVPGETPKVVPKSPGKGGKGAAAGAGPWPKGQPQVAGAVLPASPNDATFYQDLLWALMNTSEFMLNH